MLPAPLHCIPQWWWNTSQNSQSQDPLFVFILQLNYFTSLKHIKPEHYNTRESWNGMCKFKLFSLKLLTMSTIKNQTPETNSGVPNGCRFVWVSWVQTTKGCKHACRCTLFYLPWYLASIKMQVSHKFLQSLLYWFRLYKTVVIVPSSWSLSACNTAETRHTSGMYTTYCMSRRKTPPWSLTCIDSIFSKATMFKSNDNPAFMSNCDF